MALGAAVEGGATFLCRIISKTLGDINFRGSNILDAFFATALVVAGNEPLDVLNFTLQLILLQLLIFLVVISIQP